MGKKIQEKLDITEVAKQFSSIKAKYKKLGTNLVQALELFVKESKTNYLSINFRIKEENSFLEKITRKNYKQPIEETEDICGIRIICFYQSDVDKIAKIITKEFDVLDNQDKEELLKPDQFGYRSTHFIVKIKENWLEAPNYRGLENLKAEIQIRTILMHAWAEIEHKLAYKKEIHVPNQFKRKLYRISAKLEEADEQFEEMRDSINNYRESLIEISKEIDNLNGVELNLDSLQTLLDQEFPGRGHTIDTTRDLLDEFNEHKITISDFINSYERVKSILPEFEEESLKGTSIKQWAQVGVARAIMDLTNDNYFNSRELPKSIKETREKWRKIVSEKKA